MNRYNKKHPTTNLNPRVIEERFAAWLTQSYRLQLSDVAATAVKGYWQAKQVCDPARCCFAADFFDSCPTRHYFPYFDNADLDTTTWEHFRKVAPAPLDKIPFRELPRVQTLDLQTPSDVRLRLSVSELFDGGFRHISHSVDAHYVAATLHVPGEAERIGFVKMTLYAPVLTRTQDGDEVSDTERLRTIGVASIEAKRNELEFGIFLEAHMPPEEFAAIASRGRIGWLDRLQLEDKWRNKGLMAPAARILMSWLVEHCELGTVFLRITRKPEKEQKLFNYYEQQFGAKRVKTSGVFNLLMFDPTVK